MQLNSLANGSGSEPKSVPLRPSPRSPLDDYFESKREESKTSGQHPSTPKPKAAHQH